MFVDKLTMNQKTAITTTTITKGTLAGLYYKHPLFLQYDACTFKQQNVCITLAKLFLCVLNPFLSSLKILLYRFMEIHVRQDYENLYKQKEQLMLFTDNDELYQFHNQFM